MPGKLSADQIAEIRKEIGTLSYAKLGKKYGVNPKSIYRLREVAPSVPVHNFSAHEPIEAHEIKVPVHNFSAHEPIEAHDSVHEAHEIKVPVHNFSAHEPIEAHDSVHEAHEIKVPVHNFSAHEPIEAHDSVHEAHEIKVPVHNFSAHEPIEAHDSVHEAHDSVHDDLTPEDFQTLLNELQNVERQRDDLARQRDNLAANYKVAQLSVKKSHERISELEAENAELHQRVRQLLVRGAVG